MVKVKVKICPLTIKCHPSTTVYLVTHSQTDLKNLKGYMLSDERDEEPSGLAFGHKGGRTITGKSATQKSYTKIKSVNNNPLYDVASKCRYVGKENSFFNFMSMLIEQLQQSNRFGTAKNYHATLGSFKRFRNNKDIRIVAIDPFIMEDYQAYLKSTGISLNSISFYMRILHASYNRAVDQNLTEDRKPFRKVFTGVEKTRKRAISTNDIRCIKNLDLPPGSELELTRDLFLFFFFCRGMSFIDAAFLKKDDIYNDILTYRRHKTGQLLHIKIIRQIREIIDRHSDNASPYLLPIISHARQDERKQYETALRRINKNLKVIAGMLKLPITLTTYVSRHTWATIAKSKNIPVNVISDALGHDSITTTQIYLASIDASTIDKANEMIVGDL